MNQTQTLVNIINEKNWLKNITTITILNYTKIMKLRKEVRKEESRKEWKRESGKERM